VQREGGEIRSVVTILISAAVFAAVLRRLQRAARRIPAITLAITPCTRVHAGARREGRETIYPRTRRTL